MSHTRAFLLWHAGLDRTSIEFWLAWLGLALGVLLVNRLLDHYDQPPSGVSRCVSSR